MKVWVTREEPTDGPLSSALRSCGLDPVTEPVISRQIVPQAAEHLDQLGPEDWLVLTSPYAIEAAVSLSPDSTRRPKIAVIAEPSRRVAEANGLNVQLVSSGGDGRSLFEELRQKVSQGVVCYLRSSLAKIPQSWADVDLRTPILYETLPCEFDRTVAEKVDAIAVASPSAVRGVGKTQLPMASIGATTSAAIRSLGMEVWAEAREPSFEALAKAIAQAQDSRHQRA